MSSPGALKGHCPKLRKKYINIYAPPFCVMTHDQWPMAWCFGLGTKQTIKRANSRHCGLDSSLLERASRITLRPQFHTIGSNKGRGEGGGWVLGPQGFSSLAHSFRYKMWAYESFSRGQAPPHTQKCLVWFVPFSHGIGPPSPTHPANVHKYETSTH